MAQGPGQEAQGSWLRAQAKRLKAQGSRLRQLPSPVVYFTVTVFVAVPPRLDLTVTAAG